MRYLIFLFLASPLQAWEFTPGLPCVLTHSQPEVEVTLTYDPGPPLYSIAITRDGGWTPASIFSLAFNGPRPLRISTDRHEVTADGATVTVSDSGFGNVLNGIGFNTTATATLGDQEQVFSLIGAAAPMEAFRQCAPFAGV